MSSGYGDSIAVSRALGDTGMGGDGSVQSEPESVEEIAREIGVSPRRLKPTRLSALARDTRPSVEGDDEVVPLSETIIDNRVPDQDVADHEQRLLLEVALRRLNPFEAWVIRERYGLGR